MTRDTTSGAGREMLALVVDDYADGRALVCDILGHGGFTIREASTGPEAFQLAVELVPELLILDLALPGMDGWEIARRLKQMPETAAIRILALTAHAEVESLRRAHDAGCDAVMTKPCRPAQLLSEAQRLTSRLAARAVNED